MFQLNWGSIQLGLNSFSTWHFGTDISLWGNFATCTYLPRVRSGAQGYFLSVDISALILFSTGIFEHKDISTWKCFGKGIFFHHGCFGIFFWSTLRYPAFFSGCHPRKSQVLLPPWKNRVPSNHFPGCRLNGWVCIFWQLAQQCEHFATDILALMLLCQNTLCQITLCQNVLML